MTLMKLAIGDGAMGFWAALEEAHPSSSSLAPLDAQHNERIELPDEIDPAHSKGCPAFGLPG